MSLVDRTSSEFKAYLELYERAPLLELGQLADAERWRHHPENVVTYIIDRNINYTNVCVADCKFCAFYRRPKAHGGLRPELRGDRRQDRRVQGDRRRADPAAGRPQPVHPVRVVSRADALHQAPSSDPYSRLLAQSEVVFFSERFGLSVPEVVRELRAAGLDSIPGGGGEILVDAIRERVAKKKAQTEEWLGVQEEAHRQGMKTSVTMMYGLGEIATPTGSSTCSACATSSPAPAGSPRSSAGRSSRKGRRDVALREDRRGHLSPHAGDRPHRAGQRAQPAVVLGHHGPQGRPDRAALRRQRLRQPDDGGERRLRRGHDLPHHPGGDRAPHPGRRLRRQAVAARTTRSSRKWRPRERLRRSAGRAVRRHAADDRYARADPAPVRTARPPDRPTA